ncbi:cyclodeaminase/cyclohydrolase family protein [uncultured Desulfosarcina sp.]|uniref:cyclodeaminase/cyclohydrolase family protein n=1 Tax=uncultured Desulfosarcina sp. TaxID=218289 RepID=UPI0029C8E614|nr:cyclodeaminase/cyclohydrolase family protein [uncultured Desulfosarcina sp.]
MDNYIAVFEKIMDAGDNTTGGGSASSIAGAMAAGLAGMVARLSKGKAELDTDEHYQALADRAGTLGKHLLEGSAMDSASFAKVSEAFAMPKGTDEEKAARSRAIQAGMIGCAEVPLENARLCGEVLALCTVLEKKYNTNASSDLACARHLAAAGLKGCVANVRINLPYLKDEEKVRDLENEIEEISKQIQ